MSPTHIQDKDDGQQLVTFPQGSHKPHEARAWGRSLDSTLTKHEGLSSVARNRLPPGMFPKLWSEDALKPPPKLPKDATFRDQMSHRNMVDEIEKRTNQNATVIEQREEWWKTNNNLLFTIMTDSMIKSNPGLRDAMRERFHVIDGYYSGYDGLVFVQQYVEGIMERNPQHDHYEKLAKHFEDHRLPA